MKSVHYLNVRMKCWRLNHLDSSLFQVIVLCIVIIVCSGAFCIPVYMPYILTGRWMLGRGLCKLWLVMDYLLCTASVFNIVLISYDRFLSVTRAVRTNFNHIHIAVISRVTVLSTTILKTKSFWRSNCFYFPYVKYCKFGQIPVSFLFIIAWWK